MPPVANSTQLPQVTIPSSAPGDEEKGAVEGTLFSVNSITSSDSSGFTNIGLTQEMFDEESQ